MLASDQCVWEETINKTDSVQPFISKELLYVQDQNNSNYSGQIQFDLSSLANNNRWLSYQEAYLEIPFMVNFQCSTDVTAGNTLVNAFTAGLKSGYYNIIDSLQVDLNNTNIVQLQNNLNMLVNYKVLTSFSQDDLNKLGPILGVYPDTADSYTFSAGASANGDGYANNRNIPKAATFLSRNNTNEGLKKRQSETTALGVLAANVTDYLPTTGVAGDAIGFYNAEALNYFADDGGAAAARVYTWVIMATIRLKDICDWFDKVPLMKGANYRININYNSAQTTVTTVAAGPTMITTSHTQLSGHSNPVLLGSSAANNSNNALVAGAAAGVFTIVSGVVKTSLSNSITSAFNSCRLYVPAYRLDTVYQLNLLQSKPTQTIKYLDYYTYTVSGTASKTSFNSILTNGIINPKAIIIMPFASPGNAAAVNAKNLPAYQMLYDSSPSTTTPQASITNFQVQVAGENMFMTNQQYSYSQFLDEFQHLFALNGSIDTSINSGLISHFMWKNAYRYYVCNLSRRVSSEDKIPKSILISGTNNTLVAMDYVCFVLFEKSITIDTASGSIIG